MLVLSRKKNEAIVIGGAIEIGVVNVAKATVRVRPWWDLEHGVRVCKDAYRPTQWMSKTRKGDAPMACLTNVAPYIKDGGGERCGCGPNLIRCWQSAEQRLAVVRSLLDEVRGTVAHIVADDRPLEDVFTKLTTRDALVDTEADVPPSAGGEPSAAQEAPWW